MHLDMCFEYWVNKRVTKKGCGRPLSISLYRYFIRKSQAVLGSTAACIFTIMFILVIFEYLNESICSVFPYVCMPNLNIDYSESLFFP